MRWRRQHLENWLPPRSERANYLVAQLREQVGREVMVEVFPLVDQLNGLLFGAFFGTNRLTLTSERIAERMDATVKILRRDPQCFPVEIQQTIKTSSMSNANILLALEVGRETYIETACEVANALSKARTHLLSRKSLTSFADIRAALNELAGLPGVTEGPSSYYRGPFVDGVVRQVSIWDSTAAELQSLS